MQAKITSSTLTARIGSISCSDALIHLVHHTSFFSQMLLSPFLFAALSASDTHFLLSRTASVLRSSQNREVI